MDSSNGTATFQGSPSRNGHVSSSQRFTGGRRCPVCDGSDGDRRGQGSRCHGFISDDGEWCHCTREDFAGQAPYNASSQTYAHKLKGECRCGVVHNPADPKPSKAKRGTIDKVYAYSDEHGQVLFEVVRYRDPRAFRQRRPDGNSGWVWNLSGVRLVPYRLSELVAADPAEWVVVAEGEKDVDRLRSLGFVATCNPMGAGKWRPEYAESLRGRRVAIIPDNDQVGRDHAQQVARSLAGVAAEVKIVELPDVPKKGDVSDYFDQGGTADELGRLIYKAPVFVPSAAGQDEAGLPDGIRRLSDYGNAERLADRFRDKLRYCRPWGVWLAWDGRRWAEDRAGQVERYAKETVRGIGAEAAQLPDREQRRAVLQWALKSESLKLVKSMIDLARTEDGIPVTPEMFDRDPWSLNCQNGTIDLRTGVLRPHRQEDCITKLCPVPYDPDAACPLWESTLDLVFAGNADLIRYWQQLCGIVLTGTISEQILPIPFGKGENGKSTVLNALMGLLGSDYAMKAPPNFLMVRRHEGHPTELADLFGKRLVVAIETGEGARINETLIKELTGSDPIRARRMRENHWEFLPTHKVLLCTNHRPVIKGTDHAIWRRIHLIPFDVKIPADRKDKAMPEKLAGEYPGILAWAVRGCLAWQQAGGLNPPDEVLEATKEYRQDQDVLGRFLDENCTVVAGSDQVKVKASALYGAYRKWSEQSGEATMTMMAFGEKITEAGFTKKNSNGIWYLGIGLRQNDAYA